MKNISSIILKILISGLFLLIVFKKIEFNSFYNIFKSIYIPLVIISFLIIICLTFLLSLRWFAIVKDEFEKGSFFLFWKLTMIGMFFNIFLPTGAGGDIAKIFYMIKGEEKKFFLGVSVLIDRFIGSFTVMAMATIAIIFTPDLNRKIYILIPSLFFLLSLLFIFFSKRKFASFLYAFFKKFLTQKIKYKVEEIYNVFFKYFSKKKNLLFAIGISFVLQSISIFTQYLMGLSLFHNSFFSPNLKIFFIYVPIIWVATLIPSLGGLGIREFSYVFFFTPYFGKDKSFALSILVLFSVIIQSFIGAIIFFTLNTSKNK